MKYIYVILVFLLLGVWLFLQGPFVKRPVEEIAVEALLHHCLGPVLARGDPAQMAVDLSKLPELPPEKARSFLADGRVFILPEAEGHIVIQAPAIGGCSVAVRTLDPDAFWHELARFFGPQTLWTLDEEVPLPDGGLRRDFFTDIDGLVVLLVSARDTPREGGVQALMTVARLDAGGDDGGEAEEPPEDETAP